MLTKPNSDTAGLPPVVEFQIAVPDPGRVRSQLGPSGKKPSQMKSSVSLMPTRLALVFRPVKPSHVMRSTPVGSSPLLCCDSDIYVMETVPLGTIVESPSAIRSACPT